MASRDGRLKEEDQILAINSTPLSPTGSHQQAIQLLQSCKGSTYLINELISLFMFKLLMIS